MLTDPVHPTGDPPVDPSARPEEIDLVEVATDVQICPVAYQVALAVTAKPVPASLLDFLV